MLKKYFFITPDSSIRFLLFIIILMLFAFKIFLVLLVFYIGLLLLFRKRVINSSVIRTVDPSIMFAPCDGVLKKVNETDKSLKISLKVGILNHYGVRMPFTGSIRSFIQTKEKVFSLGKIPIYKYRTIVELKSRELGKIKLTFISITNLAVSRIWVRSGDKATVGAYLGYLPFGGKVIVEIPKKLDMLVKPNDKLLSAETLLAAKGKEHA